MISMVKKVEYSEAMLKIWVLMLKSKESAAPAATIWEGLTRVNRLASEYVKEHYGMAALVVDGRYYTPDCKLVPPKKETAAEKRARLRGEVVEIEAESPEVLAAIQDFEKIKARQSENRI